MVNSVDHIAIAVHDIESSCQKLYQAFGLKCSSFEIIESQEIRAAVILTDNVNIERIEPINSKSSLHRYLEKHGEGMHHLAFKVDNTDEALEVLISKGFNTLQNVSTQGVHGKRIGFLHPKSIAGTLFELCSR